MGTEQLKTCAKCKVAKNLEKDFNRNTASKDGRQRYCKDCNKGYGRAYYKTHTKKIRQANNAANGDSQEESQSTED